MFTEVFKNGVIIKNKAEYDQVLADNKSVFVDFYADWCGPCKMVGPVLEEISKDYADIKFVKVNVDDNPEIAQQYGISQFLQWLASRMAKR